MRFELEENTKVRFEKDGIYIMNSKYQTKEKITDVEGVGKLFYDAINSNEVEDNLELQKFVMKNFIVPLKSFEELLKEKNNRYTSAPIYMTLGITSGCNYRCKHCGNNSVVPKETDLTPEEIYKLFDQMIDLKLLKINFTGGEPTTRPDLVELTRYVASKNVACNLTTNGYNVPEKLIIDLKEAGLTQVQISLDSYKKEVHEKYRTEGSFDRAMETAKLFKKHGFIVGVDTVVTNDNLNDLEAFMDFLEENIFDGLTIIKLKQGHLDLETFKKQVPDYDKYAEVIDKICRRNGPLEVTIDCSSVSNLCKTLTLEEQNKIHSAGCPAGHSLISIAPNGDMFPCAALTNDNYKIGNLLTDDLEKVWNESELLKGLRGVKNKVEGKCKTCSKLDVCRGGCRGIADSLSGKKFSSDANCKINI